MLRLALVAVLGTGLAVLLLAQERTAFFLALLVMLLAFLLGAAKLAVDLVDLDPSDLVADGGLLALLGFAVTRITTGDRLLITVAHGRVPSPRRRFRSCCGERVRITPDSVGWRRVHIDRHRT